MSEVAKAVLGALRRARLAAKVDATTIEDDLILGPGWVERFEEGDSVPDLETLAILAKSVGTTLAEISSAAAGVQTPAEITRVIKAVSKGNDLEVHFQYAAHDAVYLLTSATEAQFDEVVKALRDGLAKLTATNLSEDDEKQIKTNAVATAFTRAMELWPEANPSDVWWFVIYRAYCDPFNHPAAYARLSFEQSWKRTGGWALEEIVVRHYRDELAKHDITIEIAKGDRKRDLLDSMKIPTRMESDKVDVYLLGPDDQCFGVVHVKASFAERRTDDVPMSEALIKAGYFSPLWTMDCKSTPAARPFNKGELGATDGKRSAKRKDFEDDAWFSACFSYNKNTRPTVDKAAKARIVSCDFSNPDDDFVKETVAAWKRFKSGVK